MERRTAAEHGCEAFERLYDAYYDKVYVYIFRRVNHPQTAQDLTADVFIKAFASPYNPQIARFSTYVYTIAANTLKNHYRAVSRTSWNVSLSEPFEYLSSDTDIPVDLITREECARLKSALAALPERQYIVLYRRYYLEQSFKEISGALGVAEAYARKIHERALGALKKNFLTDVTLQGAVCIKSRKAEGGDGHSD